MNILLLNPEFPDTFWSYKHALPFVGKRAAFPPLGLLTVAGMLPSDWHLRLVDLNVARLTDDDLAWADAAFISAMTVQRSAAQRLIACCRRAKCTVVAGGPLFTMEPDNFPDVNHLVLNEAELTLPQFLRDWADGRPKDRYASTEFADIRQTPPPRWDLVNRRAYYGMSIQFSRGCPFNCDFCNITSLLGRRVRTKHTTQILGELETLQGQGWHGKVFFVDDNFIGNRKQLKTDLLPALAHWRRRHPTITFQTEASIDLADDPDLMARMVDAGFDTVFIGIETPENAGLAECGKQQNTQRDLVADVRRIQQAGLQVQGGFIVGFDSDLPSVFQRQIDFIQNSGIVTAMVGLLQAPQGTRLYQRMAAGGRLRGDPSGDNVEGTTNIMTRMPFERLHAGYREILNHIYTPRHYYQRIYTLLHATPLPKTAVRFTTSDLMGLLRSLIRLGILGRERMHYWRLLTWTALRRPRLLPLAVTLAISGYHFRQVCLRHVR